MLDSRSNTDAAVVASGLSKSFGPRRALCDVDLTVRRGQVHGLLGPNGAGKTTLLRVLLGLARRDAGRLRLLDRDIAAAGGVLPAHVAGLVEMPSFYPYLSGRKNLALLSRLDQVSGANETTSVCAVLEQVGLHEHADVAVAGFSAGMRQRLGLAAALLRSPQLLVLDEATSALDPAGARDARALVRRIAGDGAAVVWSSHDMAEVEELCSVVTILDRGRVVFSGAVNELRKRAPATVHALQTSDDSAALALALRTRGMRVIAVGGSLEICADAAVSDAYMIALGRAGIAVRQFEPRRRSLESLFLALTVDGGEHAAAGTPSDDDPFDATEWQRAS